VLLYQLILDPGPFVQAQFYVFDWFIAHANTI
jgi:hypothetical protein